MTATTALDQAMPADAGLELPPFTSYVHLVSIDPAENRCRFYRLQWHPTLWGDLALVCIWGRVGTLGQVRVLHGVRTADAEATAQALLQLRLRHGYHVADWC